MSNKKKQLHGNTASCVSSKRRNIDSSMYRHFHERLFLNRPYLQCEKSQLPLRRCAVTLEDSMCCRSPALPRYSPRSSTWSAKCSDLYTSTHGCSRTQCHNETQTRRTRRMEALDTQQTNNHYTGQSRQIQVDVPSCMIYHDVQTDRQTNGQPSSKDYTSLPQKKS